LRRRYGSPAKGQGRETWRRKGVRGAVNEGGGSLDCRKVVMLPTWSEMLARDHGVKPGRKKTGRGSKAGENLKSRTYLFKKSLRVEKKKEPDVVYTRERLPRIWGKR